MSKTMLFNPYTGSPRHPSDIQSDPEGILILDPDAPMRAASPPAPSAEPVNLNDPAVQKRLAAQWGYVPAPSVERDTRPRWGVPHAGMIRCLDAAIDRLYAGDTPEEVFADFGWSLTVPPDHFAVMQQALDALEERYIGALRDSAIDALRAALGEK